MNFLRKGKQNSDQSFRAATIRVPDGILSLLAGLSIVMGVVVFLSNILAAKIWVLQLPEKIIIPEFIETFLICGFAVKNPLSLLRSWLGESIPFVGWTFTFDAGLLMFPVSFLVGDMIVEIYGKKRANMVSWMTATVNVVAFFTVYLATLLPSYDAAANVDLGEVFGASATIVLGSSVSFLVSRMLNNALFTKYRKNQQGIFKWRALRSSFWGRLTDTIIFNFIAYHGRLNDWELIRHMACAFGIGMILEWVLCEFVTSRMVESLRRRYHYADGRILP